MRALSTAEGLELFDAAHWIDEALLIPARLDIAALRALARIGEVPPLLRGIVRAPARRAQPGARSLADRLASLSPGEHERAVHGAGTGRDGDRAGARVRRRGRHSAGVQGARVRLPGGRRAAQSPERRDRAAAARHADLRLPHTRRLSSDT